MLRSKEEVLADIDATLDQLICNAEVIDRIEVRELSETEVEGFQKTQESLLARLIHMDDLLDKKKGMLRKKPSSTIEEKLIRFSELNEKLICTVKERFQKKPRVHRHRKSAVLVKR